ncbi:MAG: pantoate--beta-alanine ligase [Synechococcaceae bacterium WBB_10_009]|nr:pantoate--beta-alanine ligase [Synechococcaceae bacterium WBB_10_009]
MELLQTIAELRRWLAEGNAAPLHFVPTMGALHAGHQNLIRRAGQRRSGAQPRVLVSVFVNPLQFGPHEDFARYPRDLASDAQLAAAAGADALFAPSAAELYPEGEADLTRIQPPEGLQRGLCGARRPGHFNGVATVVVRLLALIRPDRLLLGEKDWQQLVILRRVVADLGLPVQVEGCPTQREPDGLALSSRNRYLNPQQRHQAAALPRILRAAAEGLAGSAPMAPLLSRVRQQLEQAQLVVDYVEATDPLNLQPRQQRVVAAVARDRGGVDRGRRLAELLVVGLDALDDRLVEGGALVLRGAVRHADRDRALLQATEVVVELHAGGCNAAASTPQRPTPWSRCWRGWSWS